MRQPSRGASRSEIILKVSSGERVNAHTLGEHTNKATGLQTQEFQALERSRVTAVMAEQTALQ